MLSLKVYLLTIILGLQKERVFLEWLLQVLTQTLNDIATQLLKANRFKMGA